MANNDDDDDLHDASWDDDEHRGDKIRLNRDLLLAARTMGDNQARYLVSLYYLEQEMRKRADNQLRTLEDNDDPDEVVSFVAEHSYVMEKQIAKGLKEYTSTHIMGDWLKAIHGIGPVLSAGLMAHIFVGMWCAHCRGRSAKDCEKRQADKKRKLVPHKFEPVEACPTVGHIWQFGGIAGDGQRKWVKGERRPYNAEFKTLLWKVGQSFMKFHTNPKCYYGHFYENRKAYEIENNEAGRLAERAAESLPHFNPKTESYKYYSVGKLPPAHIDARARRYCVKIFLAHFFEEWYRRTYNKEPPLPYPIAFMGHAHRHAPPPMPPDSPSPDSPKAEKPKKKKAAKPKRKAA